MTYILTSNVPELVPYLAFVLLRIPLPLTILQILAVDLGTDIVPALGLGAEPPEPEVMQRPPRSSERRLIDRFLLLRAYLFLGLIEAAAAMSAYFFVLPSSGWHWGEILDPGNLVYRQATTACLSAIVIMQVANVYLCRSERGALKWEGLVTNRVILTGIATEIAALLLIDYWVVGQRIFATEAISSSVWMLMMPFAAVMIALEEARKGMMRLWSSSLVRPTRHPP